ncbi:MAG: hypothetical protein ABIK81_02175 [candidate division WOR-3 bacterium]
MRQRIIVILVIIIAVVLILTLTRSKPEPKKTIAKQKTSTTTKSREELANPTPVKEEKKEEKQKEVVKTTTPTSLVEEEEGWGEDPFVRDFSFLTEIKDLRLTAITISESKSYALINDMILGVGDEIAGKRVVAIEKDKVVVEKGGRKFEVYLGQ